MTPPFWVQVKDSAGFWCVVGQYDDYKFACKVAQYEANESKQTIRVVSGPKREHERLFAPR